MPKVPGVYLRYFDETPPGFPTRGYHTLGAWTLLYLRVAPKAWPIKRQASQQDAPAPRD